MKQFISLLRATFSENMNLFKYNVKKDSSKIKKISIPILLTLLLMYAIGTYAYLLAEDLSKLNLTYIMITLFLMVALVTSFMEGIYKSQGMLFDSKDNDLLCSLPIRKSKIFSVRIIKLLVFQFLYTSLYIVPAFVIYAFFETPNIWFYVLSITMLFLAPIIPTLVSSGFGYIVKLLSVKFKAKRLAQTILSVFLFGGIFYVSFNIESIISNIIKNAVSINDMISKIYYPIGIYINLIEKFEIIDFFKLILINIVPLILFIYLGSFYYFKIVSKSGENYSGNKKKIRKYVTVKSPIKSLMRKELNRFFSSTVYIINSIFGVFLLFACTIGLCVNSDGLINSIINGEEMQISIKTVYQYLPIIYLQLIIFVSCLSFITASSISLEGKSFNITKSLPVSVEKILLSKVFTSEVLVLPLMLISIAIFVIKFNVSIFYIAILLLFAIMVTLLISMFGLIVNLKYPKMNASSDTEVVKQSMSTMISGIFGLLLFGLTTYLLIKYIDISSKILLVELIVIIILNIILCVVLKKYGEKRFKEINI